MRLGDELRAAGMPDLADLAEDPDVYFDAERLAMELAGEMVRGTPGAAEMRRRFLGGEFDDEVDAPRPRRWHDFDSDW